jgi:hypothetical protein
VRFHIPWRGGLMKRTLRTGLALILAGLLGTPLAAQQTTLRLPQPEHAKKGDQVVVTLHDGREIRGRVGSWIDDVGFYVKPTDSAAYLLHPPDIAAIHDAATGAALDIPLRRHRGLSQVSQAFIVVSAIGAFLLLRAVFRPIG